MSNEQQTVDVRVAVFVDEHGDWVSQGWNGGELDDYFEAGGTLESFYKMYWLNATLVLPKSEEVDADVEEGPDR